MDESTYKAFWVGYGLKYAVGAALVVWSAAVLHACVSVALNRIWSPRCHECEGRNQ